MVSNRNYIKMVEIYPEKVYNQITTANFLDLVIIPKLSILIIRFLSRLIRF